MTFQKDAITGRTLSNETISRASGVMSLFLTIRGLTKGGGYPILPTDQQPSNTRDLSDQEPAPSTIEE